MKLFCFYCLEQLVVDTGHNPVSFMYKTDVDDPLHTLSQLQM